MAGLWPSLSEKVRGRFPIDYEEAIEVACLKDKKLHLQARNTQPQQQGEGARLAQQQAIAPAQHNQPPVEEGTTAAASDQQELLNQITSHLENLSIHLVQQGNPNPPNQG